MKHEALAQGLSLVVLVIVFQVLIARINLRKSAKRRWQHLLTGHALVQVSYLLPSDVCIILLQFAAFCIFILKNFFFESYKKIFGELLREDELSGRRLPGAFYFLLGTAVSAQLFPMATTRYAVECLSIADPVASWVGGSIKSPKIHASASVAGCLACWVAAVLVGLIYLSEHASIKQRVVAACACTVAEAMGFDYDNLLIPIFTAAAVDNTYTL